MKITSKTSISFKNDDSNVEYENSGLLILMNFALIPHSWLVIFYLPSGRSFWIESLKSMASGSKTALFLGDRHYMIDAALVR
jgi:hypothetical protein